jgi:hypothetical protein
VQDTDDEHLALRDSIDHYMFADCGNSSTRGKVISGATELWEGPELCQSGLKRGSVEITLRRTPHSQRVSQDAPNVGLRPSRQTNPTA